MLWVAITFVLVFAVLGSVGYGLLRPFTHVGYRHPEGRLWHPLD